MIDVAHDGDDRRPRHEVFGVVRLPGGGQELFLGVGLLLDVQLAAELQRHRFGHVRVERRVDGGEDALVHQLEEQLAGADADGLGKRADGDRQFDRHLALARHGGFLPASCAGADGLCDGARLPLRAGRRRRVWDRASPLRLRAAWRASRALWRSSRPATPPTPRRCGPFLALTPSSSSSISTSSGTAVTLPGVCCCKAR